ncbi:PLP-dependent aminotransferase family protein [cf. Phormidesmis sp. LEGE 11477]|uniref:MocR-like pyridoxine biosynthesis transcription factor PdxR n=1 Tax=cf. Phormidesmis sp. LEGE 11477 TaxID=1828680 RepID=UPI001881B031|nr:PLP-dependent aminotransferase family protein [cf. Phormidesmis sp. LEGE 11477]MBE9059568.1 PLP-dependent aminotransferase family protein [cf. Phormidesmis sp. LEGE 11477]
MRSTYGKAPTNSLVGWDLTIDLRSDSDVALHRQIYDQIRTAILTGRVRSHQKLPASRQLAIYLGVSRTTVTLSYDQLISEGYLHTKPGAGTFVCAQIPDSMLSASSASANPTANDSVVKPLLKPAFRSVLQSESAIAESVTADQPSLTELLSAYGNRLHQLPKPPAETHRALSFRYWQPDVSLFPTAQWQRCINRCRSANADWMDYSADALGYKPLRTEIANYIAQTRAVHCSPDQILITQGTQQALSLIVRVVLDPGEAIALENPGYLSARKVFSSHGATLIPIPADSNGLQVNEQNGLAAQSSSSRIKLVYVTPSHQFPTGVLMALPRRLALLQWAQQTNALIIEDDYDSEYRYGGRPIPALQGLDTHQRVLYVGTFSKVMFPGIQLGYIVLPPALVAVFAQAKWMCDRQTSLIHQAALTDFIAQGHLARHIRRMRTVYAQRREVLITALEKATRSPRSFIPDVSTPDFPTSSSSISRVARTPGTLEIVGDPAGLHVMVKLPTARQPNQQHSDQQLVLQASRQGVALFSTQPYYLPSSSLPTTAANREFIFGFGGLKPPEITEAIARIQPYL